MTAERLTAMLAERIMGWKVGPARYMMGGRQWQPHWRFQPVLRMADSIRLLEQAAAEEFTMGAAEVGGFWARVRIAGVTGEARESSQARALTFAIARATGINPEVSMASSTPTFRIAAGRSLPWQECRGRSQKAMETAAISRKPRGNSILWRRNNSASDALTKLSRRAEMTKSRLNPDQHRTVEIIEGLGFGVIERLVIRDGMPYFEPAPRIVQAIKLDSEPARPPDRGGADLTLKKEFESLFDQLSRLRDGTVDIEVRHSLPFRLALERPFMELL